MVIEDINRGVIPGMTVAKAAFLSECAVSCLSRQGHSSGVQMKCEGIVNTQEPIFWTTPYTDQLARSTNDLQEAVRLEISGILNGKDKIKTRKKQKLQQTNQSDSTNLPAYVSIVEFGIPAIDFDEK